MVQRGGSEGHPDVGQPRDPPGEVHRRVRESGQLPPLHRLHPQRQEEGRDHGGDEAGTSTVRTQPSPLCLTERWEQTGNHGDQFYESLRGEVIKMWSELVGRRRDTKLRAHTGAREQISWLNYFQDFVAFN